MIVRDASPDDADAACDVLRRSIAELCTADHGNDPAILAWWLGNKTPDQFRSWLRPGNSVLVAVEGETIGAVGAVSDAGEINLNYVAPEARFRGYSRAMVRALEGRALECGNARCVLNSTKTALRFYRANGYSDAGSPVRLFGIAGYPMVKSLEP